LRLATSSVGSDLSAESTNVLGASDTGGICRQYPIVDNTVNTTMTGMVMTAADGLGMWRVALPWAWPELLARAALEIMCLDSLLLVLSGAARGLFAVNMDAFRADWLEDGKQSASLSKWNFDSTWMTYQEGTDRGKSAHHQGEAQDFLLLVGL
jgi:hypothetical protein